MGFFFNKIKQQRKTKKRVQPSLTDFSYEQQCEVCPLRKQDLRHPKIEPSGVDNPIIYNLGTVPGKKEDIRGNHFIGEEGELLREALDSVFGKRFIRSSVRWNTVVRCRAPRDRDISQQEIECCRKSVEEDIEKSKPLVILGYGRAPLKWLLNVNGIRDLWRGRRIPVKVGNHVAWYFPLIHPFDILSKRRKGYKSDWDLLFERDLKRVADFLSQKNILKPEVIDKDYDKHIVVVEGTKSGDFELIEKALEKMKKYFDIALDIEDIPLKPWESKDARMVSIAIGTDKDVIAYSLEHPKAWNGKYEKILALTEQFLLTYQGTIYCHNLKHELMWFYWYFGEKVLRETKWGCTLRMGYVIDERTKKKRNMGMHGLGRMCLIYLGFDLKVLVNIDFKNMLDEPLDKLLLYNGRDSKYEFALSKKLEPLLEGKLRDIYEHHVRNAITLAITESSGLEVDTNKIRVLSKDLEKQLIVVEKKILSLSEVTEYEKIYGDFKQSSPKDLISMFEKILKYPLVKGTAKGNYSVDESVMKVFMEEHNSKLAEYILEFRGLSKQKSTYLDNIPKRLSSVDGKLHAQFNDTLTSTGRFSSEDPNMQNFPKRKNKHIRGIIICIKHHWFVALDYGQIEARVICMFSKDKQYIKDIFNGFDIHEHWAKVVAKAHPAAAKVDRYSDLTAEGLDKFRSKVKNGLVFPWFYLASFKSVARGLAVPESIMEKLYNEFWDYFAGVKVWQKKVIADYAINGYVEMLTGRRRRDPLGYTKLANTPVQGTASDLVTDSGNRISLLGYEQVKPQFTFRLNVHDDLSYYLPDKTLDTDLEFIAKEMVRPTFDFINVPLTAEVSVGKNWYEMEKIHTFDSRDFGFKIGEV